MNTRNAMQLKALINNKAKAAHVSKHSYAADITFQAVSYTHLVMYCNTCHSWEVPEGWSSPAK